MFRFIAWALPLVLFLIVLSLGGLLGLFSFPQGGEWLAEHLTEQQMNTLIGALF
jgi:hypothetical protein